MPSGSKPLPRSSGETPAPRLRPFRLVNGPIRRVMISPCLSAAGIRFWEHPVPAGGLYLPYGWPTADLIAADPIGVTVCYMVEMRLGRAPSVLRGRWCPWTDGYGHQPHRTPARDVHDPIHRISRLRCSIMTKPHQGFTRVRPSSLLLARARPTAGHALRHHPSLHTPPLPATHVWVGYHWQYNRLPPDFSVVTNTCTTSCRTLTVGFTRLADAA